MTLEEKLITAARVVLGTAGAALGFWYGVDRFDYSDIESIRWSASIRAGLMVTIVSGAVGVGLGSYIGRRLAQAIEYYSK